MSEINLGQFIKSSFDYVAGQQSRNTQAANVNAEKFVEAQKTTAKIINETVQNIQRNFVQQSNILLTQMQLKQLSAMERSALLKELFSFPDDIQEFLKLVITDGKTQIAQKELAMLMTQTLDISKLVVLLKENGKEAVEKLAKMIAILNQSGIYNTQQLKELSSVINACIAVSDTNPAQVLKNIMLMYLPWLPLTENAGFNIGFEEGSEKRNKDSDDTITIIITTKYFGVVKIFLFKDGSDLNIEITCSETFPKEDLKAAIGMESSVKNAKIAYVSRKTEQNEESKETKINFSGTSRISPQMLLLTHMLVKLVLDIDSAHDLRTSRKNMQNGDLQNKGHETSLN